MSDRTNGNGVVRMPLNVPAVERLIAGDTELEVYLRQQVKTQVFDNVMTQMMSHPEVTKLVEAFNAKVEDVFREECSKEIATVSHDWHGRETITFKSSFKLAIDKQVETIVEPMVANLVKAKVQQTIDTWQLLSDVKLAKLLETCIEKRISDGINQRLAAAANAVKGVS